MKQYEIRLDWLAPLPDDQTAPSASVSIGLNRHATRLYLIPADALENAIGEGADLEALCTPSEMFYGKSTYFSDGSVSLVPVMEEGRLSLRISYSSGNGRWGEQTKHLLPLGEELSYRIYQYESTMGDVYYEFDESYHISFRLRED